MTRVVVVGATGKMGKRICSVILNDPSLTLVGAISRNSGSALCLNEYSTIPCNIIVSSSLYNIFDKVDVVIDFSTPDGTIQACKECTDLGIPLIIGTTGLSESQEALIENACTIIPLIHAMNFSLGVNLLCKLSAQVAKTLGSEYNIEIVESHHNKKVDAPSGTAYAIADSICNATDRTRGDLKHGRSGRNEKRTTNEIGIHALRLGNVVGEHTVYFANDSERIMLSHHAESKNLFAEGAVFAAKWLYNKKRNNNNLIGRFTISDVLDL